MKRFNRFFSALMAAVIIAVMLPISAAAAAFKVEAHDKSDFIIEGTPQNLKASSNYTAKVVKYGNQYKLEISEPHFLSTPEVINLELTYDGDEIDEGYKVKWCGLSFSLANGKTSWAEKKGGFSIIDNTTTDISVISKDIKLINFQKRDIDRGTIIKPIFEITDPNVTTNQLPSNPESTAYLRGITSNESFPLVGDGNEGLQFDFVNKNTNNNDNVVLQVTMPPLRYTGEGNSVSFRIEYKLRDGSVQLLDCTTTIPYTIEKSEEYLYDDDEEDFVPDDTPIPYIIVDSYDYGASTVTAGENFELTLRLRNTSTEHSLENIVMSVSPMGVFSMASSSNTFYINRLMAGSIMEKKITINTGLTKVTDDEDANSIDIKFSYQYGIKENDVLKLKSGNSNESITLPVTFPDRFELGAPEFNSRVFAGEEMYLTVPMVNKGRSSVYNLSATVKGDMSNPGQTQYIGNLNAGTESSADFTLIFETPGTHSGEVVVTYEDTNMNPKEKTIAFSVNVQEMNRGKQEPDIPIMPEEPSEPVDVQPEQDKTKPIKIVLALLVGSMSAYTTVAKAKAKRSIYLDEDI